MKKNFGFTLVEMLIVIALTAIAGLVLLNVFIGHNRIYRSQTAELDVTNDIRVSLDDIDNYVRQSTRTLSTYTTFTAGPQVLILQIQSINSTNQLVPGKYDYVIYVVSGSQLSRQIIADSNSARVSSTKQLSSHLTSLTFTYNNLDYTQVTEVATDITESESTGTQARIIHYNSKARLRNY